MGILGKSVKPYSQMKGLHLYHAAPSNCSQRVRVVLEEKEIEWEGHLVNLAANEHLQPDYQRLHPDGVVPALVHDGKVIIESNDIIRYIDDQFDDYSLYPESESDRQLVEQLLTLSSGVQESLKLLSYTYLYAHRSKKSEQQLESYDRLQQNKELVAWHRKFSTNGFDNEDLENARQVLTQALVTLEETLSGRDWLSGASFGLADISWMVNVHRAHRLEACKADLLNPKSFKAVEKWFTLIKVRQSFSRALTDYEAVGPA